MAYHFLAEKRGEEELEPLSRALSRLEVIEVFPVEISGDLVAIGISIPFKIVDRARFPDELRALLSFLICERDFQVIDLYTGQEVTAAEVPSMAQRISS